MKRGYPNGNYFSNTNSLFENWKLILKYLIGINPMSLIDSWEDCSLIPNNTNSNLEINFYQDIL